MTKKILVTGASGFVGSHLVELLLQKQYEVFGTVFGSGEEFLASLLDSSHIIKLNLLDKNATSEIVGSIKPNFVIHLAALSSPAKSHSEPEKTLVNNITAQLNLFEALIALPTKPTTIIIGSAQEYGLVKPDELPISELNPLRPNSPYAVSKITQDFMGYQYYLTHQLPVIRLRPFNHTGERQLDDFVIPAFAKQVAEIEIGHRQQLEIKGNLSDERDFTDVKDMVVAYELALNHCQPGEVYNVGSGNAISIQQVLDTLISLSAKSVEIKKTHQLPPSKMPKLVCNVNKFNQATGWQPQIPLADTLKRVLNYWRQILKEHHE